MILTREVLRSGRRCTVFALVIDGRSEVAEWLNDLPDDDFRKLMATVTRLAADGFIPNQQKFRRLESGVYKLKLRHPPVRLFCFQHGPDWVCTHGDRKPGSRELRTHVAKVRALRHRFLEEGK